MSFSFASQPACIPKGEFDPTSVNKPYGLPLGENPAENALLARPQSQGCVFMIMNEVGEVVETGVETQSYLVAPESETPTLTIPWCNVLYPATIEL